MRFWKTRNEWLSMGGVWVIFIVLSLFIAVGDVESAAMYSWREVRYPVCA